MAEGTVHCMVLLLLLVVVLLVVVVAMASHTQQAGDR